MEDRSVKIVSKFMIDTTMVEGEDKIPTKANKNFSMLLSSSKSAGHVQEMCLWKNRPSVEQSCSVASSKSYTRMNSRATLPRTPGELSTRAYTCNV